MIDSNAAQVNSRCACTAKMLLLMLVLLLVLEEWLYVVYEVLRLSSGFRALP